MSLRQVYGSRGFILELAGIEPVFEELTETLAAQPPALGSLEREADDGYPLVGVSAVAAGVAFGFAQSP